MLKRRMRRLLPPAFEVSKDLLCQGRLACPYFFPLGCEFVSAGGRIFFHKSLNKIQARAFLAGPGELEGPLPQMLLSPRPRELRKSEVSPSSTDFDSNFAQMR
jgi:hypothetical protein